MYNVYVIDEMLKTWIYKALFWGINNGNNKIAKDARFTVIKEEKKKAIWDCCENKELPFCQTYYRCSYIYKDVACFCFAVPFLKVGQLFDIIHSHFEEKLLEKIEQLTLLNIGKHLYSHLLIIFPVICLIWSLENVG